MVKTALTPFPGVLRRSDSNLYQFGLRVPRDLLSHFPNAWAVRRSLGTADLREANDKARSLQAEWAARFESLRTNKPMPLDVVALRAKLLAYVERFLLTADRRSIALTPTEREGRARDIAWQLDRRPLSTPMVWRLHTQLGIPAESLIRPPKLP